MARQFARHDKHRVDADILAASGVAGGEALGGRCDPAQAILVKAPGCVVFAAALLDLDEGDNPAAFGDQINLAAGNTDTLVENPPAFQAKPPCSKRFGLAAARFGLLAAQRSPPSSRARA